ncbi:MULTISPECIES: hypothetical protein [unclassified Mucilaginibacter]|uniref:hypothetical protein n=1 Tax=unclassified Mucilaginibacter TaxID=2617802 RepID=UPI00095E55BA|nr:MULTISPECIES: hypothetical protein [unclassified Mucilaginibacter]OJW14493.1 MAG: hypothetical protein BGO48_15225 [Mucilaginibacter sp. 44-25]PLW89370.1 MAG: hypothetical protein C0154_11860 [Mucilaginibacter sp.]HEK21620.1 hypothetical protein [Bacteroidota bacterium]
MKKITVYLRFVVFILLLAAPPYVLQSIGKITWLVPKFWALFFLITVFTFMVIAALGLVQRVKPGLYAQTFLATTVVKMLGCMAFALVFVSKIHPDHGVFLANFCYLYFLNTAFEVYVLLCNLRNQN